MNKKLELWIVRKPREIGYEYDIYEFKPECPAIHMKEFTPLRFPSDEEIQKAAEEYVNNKYNLK